MKEPEPPHQSSRQSGRLLELLVSNGTMENVEIRQLLGLKDRPHVRQFYIHPVHDQGLIEYTQLEKTTSRFQKYRITPKGARCWIIPGKVRASYDLSQYLQIGCHM